MTIEEREAHAMEFLEYVAANEKKLKKALAKNTTYCEEIFDDVYQDTIVRCYNNILKNNTKVKDFENYFFIAEKWNYINADNLRKKNLKREDRDFFYNVFHNYDLKTFPSDYRKYFDEMIVDEVPDILRKEARARKITELMKFVQDRIESKFPPNECDMFMIYFKLKSEKKGVSYGKLAEIMGVDERYVAKCIKQIKQFVKDDDEINEMKRELIDNDVDDTELD